MKHKAKVGENKNENQLGFTGQLNEETSDEEEGKNDKIDGLTALEQLNVQPTIKVKNNAEKFQRTCL